MVKQGNVKGKGTANVEVLLKLTVKDKDGRVLSEEERPSHSFVIQFLEFVYALFYGGGVYFTGTNNAEQQAPVYTASTESPWAINAPDNISTYGVVVGSGSGAESNTDYKLGTQISHLASNLDYGPCSVVAAVVVGSNVDCVITRSFYNASGGSLTINEIGIYACTGYGTTSGSPPIYQTGLWCILRDLTGGISLGNTNTLTVQYTVRTTV